MRSKLIGYLRVNVHSIPNLFVALMKKPFPSLVTYVFNGFTMHFFAYMDAICKA